jgi:channel protein (hemolysin III family)
MHFLPARLRVGGFAVLHFWVIDTTVSWAALLGCQPVSSISHLLAAGVAFAAAVPLVRLGRGNPTRILSLSVYVFCVVAALAISGAYHSLARGGSARIIMQRVDHYAIWLLIAGTFTAVHGVMCKGFWRGGLLAIIWTYAFTGIFLQVFWFDRFSGTLGLSLYLGLGWIGLASIIKLGRQIGYVGVLPILYAGFAFSSGAILEACNWPVVIAGWMGAHELFHFAVVVGIALHWLFIRKLLRHHLPSDPQLAVA